MLISSLNMRNVHLNVLKLTDVKHLQLVCCWKKDHWLKLMFCHTANSSFRCSMIPHLYWLQHYWTFLIAVSETNISIIWRCKISVVCRSPGSCFLFSLWVPLCDSCMCRIFPTWPIKPYSGCSLLKTARLYSLLCRICIVEASNRMTWLVLGHLVPLMVHLPCHCGRRLVCQTTIG